MATCPARFPVHLTGAGWSPEPVPGSTPGFLTCVLEAGHDGPHCSPAPSTPLASHLAWEFIPGYESPLSDHPNCRCEIQPLEPRLPVIDSTYRLPPWFVAEALEELVGPTPRRIFHPGP